MKFLKLVNTASEAVQNEYDTLYYVNGGGVTLKKAKLPNIVLYYDDGTVQKYPDATAMTWNLISGKTSFSSLNTTLVKTELNNGVTSIGDWAFTSCSSLTSVTIPNGVTSIGNYAFNSCSSLISVTIPNSVTSIGIQVFADCKSITSVTIPDSVTSIGDAAFGGCSSLTSVTIPDSVTSIGNSTFNGCSSLTSITIPNGVTSIGVSAFPSQLTNTTDIHFDGTIAEFKAKGFSRFSLAITCIDGVYNWD